jgi:hypothetical protein
MDAAPGGGAVRTPFEMAADWLDPPGGGVEQFYDDPVGFAEQCLRWPEGQSLTAYQARYMRRLVEHKRIAVRGPHGLGKTACNAILILWFALTRDARGVDWKIITTASTWRQLEEYLWPEMHTKWVPRLKWQIIGRDPFTTGELQKLRLRLRHGHAVAVACEDPAKIEGAHADSLLYIYDEAKTIPAATFEASMGAFSGAGEDTEQEAYALVTSTPGEPIGTFYEIHARRPGYERYEAIHVSKQELIEAGRMSEEFVEEMASRFGRDSSAFQNRVEGEFATGEADGLIPLRWVQEANDRWLDWARGELDLSEQELLEKRHVVHSARSPMPGVHGLVLDHDEMYARSLTSMGLDIADSGGDRTVAALRWGNVIGEIRRMPRADPAQTADYVGHALNTVEGAPCVVLDAVGVGAGTSANLRKEGVFTIAFRGSEKTDFKDESGEMLFERVRSAAYWHLRDLLDPNYGHEVCLPPDDLLTADLTAPRWKTGPNGRVQVEPKVEVQERLGRSPDTGDAVVMAFWYGAVGVASPPILKRRVSPMAPLRHTAQGVRMGTGRPGALARAVARERGDEGSVRQVGPIGW